VRPYTCRNGHSGEGSVPFEARHATAAQPEPAEPGPYRLTPGKLISTSFRYLTGTPSRVAGR
jgi:hypothetical protein